jgi:hypothetical protein
MKLLQAVMLIFSLGLAGMAQPRRHAANARPDLMSALLQLDRATAATNSDISHLQIGKWKGGWKTGFTTSNTHKNKAGQAAQSLQRNLTGALPQLIREAINSHGALAPTFKVYEDVSLVVQTLDSLLDIAQEYGTKREYQPLIGDYNTLARTRRTISTYIQQRAEAIDAGGPSASNSRFSSMSFSSDRRLPRRIIVDDTVHSRRSVSASRKKKSIIRFNNVE